MVWNMYKSVLSRHPLLTKATTACGLMSISDILCQTLEQSMNRRILLEQGPYTSLQGGCPTNVTATFDANENHTLTHYNWTRTAHVGITGLTFSGPISHAWYGILERLVPQIMRSSNSHVAISIGYKMLLDAFLFSPIAVAGYFIWRATLEGKDWKGIMNKLQSKWKLAVIASWSFWPVANIV